MTAEIVSQWLLAGVFAFCVPLVLWLEWRGRRSEVHDAHLVQSSHVHLVPEPSKPRSVPVDWQAETWYEARTGGYWKGTRARG